MTTLLTVSGMTMCNLSHSQPSAVDDAEFLFFLADSVEQNGQLLDALSMAEPRAVENTGTAIQQSANNQPIDATANVQISKPQIETTQMNTQQEDSHE